MQFMQVLAIGRLDADVSPCIFSWRKSTDGLGLKPIGGMTVAPVAKARIS